MCPPDESLEQATRRIVKLLAAGLTEAGAAWWCARVEFDIQTTRKIIPPLHTTAPRRPMLGDRWLDTSVSPRVVKECGPKRTWRIVLDNIKPSLTPLDVRSLLSIHLSEFEVEVKIRWPDPGRLRLDVQRMLNNRMDRAGKSGRPAYLACATLAALLEVGTNVVIDLLANYRRTL